MISDKFLSMEEEATVLDLCFGEDSEEKTNAEQAGAIRGAIRGTIGKGMRRLGQQKMGSIPRTTKVNPKFVAKHADRLSTLADVHSSVSANQAQDANADNKQAASDSKKAGKRRGSFQKYGLLSLAAIPSFMRNAVQGAVLFGTYESASVYLKEKNLTSKSYFTQKVAIPSLDSALAYYASGMLAGAVHGLCYSGLEYAAPPMYNMCSPLIKCLGMLPKDVLPPKAPAPLSMRGTVFSHAIVHSLLFGTYHHAKYLILGHRAEKGDSIEGDEGTEQKEESLHVVATIAIVGVGSGFIAELSGHFLKPFEQPSKQGIAARLRATPPWPSPFSILLAAVTSGIGFLALEFA